MTNAIETTADETAETAQDTTLEAGLEAGPDTGPEASDEAPATAPLPFIDLDRPQKRLLKRLYNARTVPVMADDRPFLTYKDACRYLLSLPVEPRESAYAQMKAHVRDKVR